MYKAIALYSGGLDSLLSIIIVRKQSIEVLALKFITGFNSPLKEQDIAVAKRFGFEIEEIDIREKFIEVLKRPKFGYGKNLNPCIDCKILMLKETKKIMLRHNASFIITGEVLGQRPMSQRREIFELMQKETELEDLILRPLSAKLLPLTKPEKEGVVDRTQLFAIWGRTRKPQMAIAKEFGLKEIPQPAGGCLLTDPTFCKRVKDLIEHNELNLQNVELLRLGRHFRISERCKAIVGRNKEENEVIIKIFKGLTLYPADFKGPVVAVVGQYTEKDIDYASKICVYYCKKDMAEIVIKEDSTEYKKIYSALSMQEIIKCRL
ncbi:MAG: hypothetical protein NZ809_03815 [Thermodesulfovibrio sp.]|nr:hypothetical protein [Thermodesulfovibrio sp.]